MKNIPTFEEYLHEKEIYDKKGNMKSSEVDKVTKELNRLFKDLSAEFTYQPDGLIKLSKGTGNVEADAYLQGIRGDVNKTILKEKNLFVSDVIADEFTVFILYNPDVEVKRQEFNLLDSDMSSVYYIENNLSDVYFFLEQKSKDAIIKNILLKYKNRIINPSLDNIGRVCADSVDLSSLNLNKLPFVFGEIDGHFNCCRNNLKTLEGAPEYVEENFICKQNELTSLKGCPKEVKVYFNCSNNNLKNLIGGVDKTKKFNCSYNKLKSLEGSPTEVDDFDCSNCDLTSLKGCPEKVSGSFNCEYNSLKNLEGSPKKIGKDFYCKNCDLPSLEGSPEEIGGDFICSDNFINSLQGCPKKVGNNFVMKYNECSRIIYEEEVILHCKVEGNIIV